MNLDVLIASIFWSFVPSTLTSFIQRSLYKFKLLTPSTPQKQKSHSIFIFTVVILSYFAFSVTKTVGKIKPNFYSVLDVPIDFKTKDLKLNYRALSLKYHPDKNGHLEQKLKDEYHERYLMIRKAYEVLSDKATLFAYEKFSDGMLECNNCRTRQDFMYDGLTNSLLYHGLSNIIVIIVNLFSDDSSNSYWRYYYLFAQISIEFYLMACNFTLRNWTTGEVIIILRGIGVSGYMAMNSLLSIWSIKTKQAKTSIAELSNINRKISGDLVNWYKWMYEPLSSDEHLEELKEKMKEYGFITRLSRSSSLEQLSDPKKSENLKKND